MINYVICVASIKDLIIMQNILFDKIIQFFLKTNSIYILYYIYIIFMNFILLYKFFHLMFLQYMYFSFKIFIEYSKFMKKRNNPYHCSRITSMNTWITRKKKEDRSRKLYIKRITESLLTKLQTSKRNEPSMQYKKKTSLQYC